MSSRIADLFNHIAPHYDFLNHLLSFQIDRLWRKKALKKAAYDQWPLALDVACGTGDFAIQLMKSGASKVEGVDISDEMIKVGCQKVLKAGWQQKIHLSVGDGAALPFADNTFDIVTVAFGVRNFEERAKSLAEIHRVLKPNAQTVILEFSMPTAFPIKQCYTFYFKRLLPLIGGMISGDKKAYEYLPESVARFPKGDDFLKELQAVGFSDLHYMSLSFGIAAVYYGTK